jgi:hypothetical protein
MIVFNIWQQLDIFETKLIQNYSSIVTHLGLVLHRSLHKLGLNFSYATTPFPKEAQELFFKEFSSGSLSLPSIPLFSLFKHLWRQKREVAQEKWEGN